MIKLINAHDKNGVIGLNNVMPWHIKEELTFFKNETLNESLLMGRKTFEGIGKVLPNRTTYVLTSDVNYQVDDPNVVVINDAQKLIEKFVNSKEILFISGGKKIYDQFYNYASELIISIIDGEYEGDTYFSDIDFSKYTQIERKVYNGFVVNRYCKNIL